jgi:sarcosine oxidase subunit alpha
MSIEQADVVIVGAGPAGLAAAAEISRNNGSVVIIDEAPFPGGRLPAQIHKESIHFRSRKHQWSNGAERADHLVDKASSSGVKILCGVSVWGIFPGWYTGLAPVYPDSRNNNLPCGIQSRAVIVASGAVQNPVMLPGWTLPGVITAGAAQNLINVHRILPGRRAVVVGIDPLSLAVAQLLVSVGARVQGVVLPPANGLQFGSTTPKITIKALGRLSHLAPTFRLALGSKISAKASPIAARLFPKSGIKVDGFPVMLRRAVMAVEGEEIAQQAMVASLKADGTVEPGSEEIWPVDVVITSAGLSPLAELLQVANCPLVYVPDLGGWVPVHNGRLETPLDGLFVAGSVTGVEGAEVAEAQGRLAGLTAAGYLGLVKNAKLEKGIARYRAGISIARKNAFPFFAGIKKGRDFMSRYWKLTVNQSQ